MHVFGTTSHKRGCKRHGHKSIKWPNITAGMFLAIKYVGKILSRVGVDRCHT